MAEWRGITIEGDLNQPSTVRIVDSEGVPLWERGVFITGFSVNMDAMQTGEVVLRVRGARLNLTGDARDVKM